MTKNEKKELHKIAILSGLLINSIDELPSKTRGAIDFHGHLTKVEQKCAEIMDKSFGLKSVSSSTYVQELSHKVDTIIRKNYQEL